MHRKAAFARQPVILGVVAAIVLLFAGFLIVRALNGTGGGGVYDDKWMYDLNTGRLVRAEASTLAPADSESGAFDYPGLGSAGALVDAAVQSCGDATAIRDGMTLEDLRAIDASVSYVSRANSEYVQAITAGQAAERTDLISTPEGKQWEKKLSPGGMKLVAAGGNPCADGELPRLTRP